MGEDGSSVVFTSPGEGVTALDVHPLNKVFGFAELCLNPKVFVYKYPEMDLVSTLEGRCMEAVIVHVILPCPVIALRIEVVRFLINKRSVRLYNFKLIQSLHIKVPVDFH